MRFHIAPGMNPAAYGKNAKRNRPLRFGGFSCPRQTLTVRRFQVNRDTVLAHILMTPSTEKNTSGYAGGGIS